MVPEKIQKFIDAFSRLPSLGPRLATRLAFFLTGADPATLHELEGALAGLKSLARCERCFFLRDAKQKLCTFCADPRRNPKIIAIVEKEMDVLALERTAQFRGQYLVLGELPEKGVLESAQRLRLAALKSRIQNELGGQAEEIILAVNSTTVGDFAFDLVRQEFRGLAGKITRLGRGIPTGGEIEFADEETLSSALERRV